MAHDPATVEMVARAICGPAHWRSDVNWRNCETPCFQANKCAGTPGDYIEGEARAILDALTAAGWGPAGEGWRRVPVEPTEAMLDAAEGALSAWRAALSPDERMTRLYRPPHQGGFIASATTREKHQIRWAAMLNAAPPLSDTVSKQGNEG